MSKKDVLINISKICKSELVEARDNYKDTEKVVVILSNALLSINMVCTGAIKMMEGDDND